jgi:hypothetical protein
MAIFLLLFSFFLVFLLLLMGLIYLPQILTSRLQIFLFGFLMFVNCLFTHNVICLFPWYFSYCDFSLNYNFFCSYFFSFHFLTSDYVLCCLEISLRCLFFSHFLTLCNSCFYIFVYGFGGNYLLIYLVLGINISYYWYYNILNCHLLAYKYYIHR